MTRPVVQPDIRSSPVQGHQVTAGIGRIVNPHRVVEELITEFGYAQRFPEEQYAEPHGDPGLFGPDSVVWKVHSDLMTVVIASAAGGFLTALHPAIAAGVVDYDTRLWKTPVVRASRTLSYIFGSTYGATPVAEKIASRLERAHRRVEGETAAGQPYHALDSDLITFVHTAEGLLFLRAYRRYHPGAVSDAAADRYIAEMARLGELLGGSGFPETMAEVDAYFANIRPNLGADRHSRKIFEHTTGVDHYRSVIVRRVLPIVTEAGIDLLPAWAQDMYEIPAWRRALAPVVARPLAHALVRAVSTLYGPAKEYQLAMARCSQAPATTVD